MTVSPSESVAKPRILLAKPGMDGHNRGVRMIAHALTDRGCEVIYLGIRRSAQEIAAAAVQEDVDIVGISLLSGAHLSLTRKVRHEMDAAGALDVALICGGIIPKEDHEALRALGVRAVFTPGTSLNEIESVIWDLYREKALGLV
jgi:methylmalonyl-CoA mutase C-terminal domain/subunit